jgi:putative intracellular protease/amidase
VGLTEVVPFMLENRLRERGTTITKAPNVQAHTAVSERLVTGQDPASATPMAEEVLRVPAGRSVAA